MSRLENRRIILVGGAGFIGHNLALKLKELGASVFIIDNLLVNNYYSFIDKSLGDKNDNLYLKILDERFTLLEKNKIPLIQVDARDYKFLSDIFTKLDVDTIIHLAAVAHAGKSNKDPYSTFDHSSRTLENSLDIARSSKLNIKHFVYFSSSMVYGNFKSAMVTEETVCEPLGIYGALKFGGEKIVMAYNQVFGIPYTIVRPSALYGPRCVSRRVGQLFIENALKGLPVEVNGDGSDRLDFTYIDDLVQGVVKILENKNSYNNVFNLTYGESRSIKQMADIIAEHFPKIEVQYLPKDNLMPDRGTLCVDKARKLIGYSPEFPLEKGFHDYIKWYKSVWGSLHGSGQGAAPREVYSIGR